MPGAVPEDLAQVAKVLKSSGTSGDILLGIRDLDPQDINIEEPVFIFFDGLPVPFFINSFEEKGSSKAVVHLMDVDSLKDAEELVGRAVMMSESLFEEETEEGSLEDFVGMKVLDPAGGFLGEITDTEDIPGNPCLYVKTGDGQEHLIPLHEDFIVSIEGDKITMNLPEGLL